LNLGARAADAAAVEKIGLQRAVDFLSGIDIAGDMLQMHQTLERSLGRWPHRVAEIGREMQCAHALTRGGEQEFYLRHRRRLTCLG
jgi:hypothetical protein